MLNADDLDQCAARLNSPAAGDTSLPSEPPYIAGIAVDASKRIGTVNPHLYGHFIEHLGDCIQHGIWAELLDGRKFAHNDSKHSGVVDPWAPVGAGDNVFFTHDNTVFYSGRQSQRVDVQAADGRLHGVAQSGVCVRGGRPCHVRLVLRQRDLDGPVTVSFGPDREQSDVRYAIPAVGAEWGVYEFDLTPVQSNTGATFSITFSAPGTLWLGAASLMPADNVEGMRPDTLEMIRGLRPPILRWPGGNFASNYHWMDGIGERDKRPVRYDRAWDSFEPDDFGADDFLALCRLLDTEPYICVNTGDGAVEEAAAWVEYCNGPATSKYGAMRAANGRPAPYGVTYWGVGNEMYGNWQIGHVDAETYARRAVEFARAMRAVDPDIKLIAVGDQRNERRWNEFVAGIAGPDVDYVSVHHYTPGTQMKWRPADEELYPVVTAAPIEIEHVLRETRAALDKYGPAGKRLGLAFDEWNVWVDGTVENGLRERYCLRDGLYAAGVFNVLHRLCNQVDMANLAQLVNVLGAITTSPDDIVATPIYLAFQLYRHHSGPVTVESRCESRTYHAMALGVMPAQETAPFLDCSATLDEARGKLYVAVVNRHKSLAQVADMTLAGAKATPEGRAFTLTGPGPFAYNDFGNKDNVRIEEQAFAAQGSPFRYSFPAHSATVLELGLS